MTTQTKTRQQVDVGAGLALGLLASGIEAISSNEMAVEFAFRYAWRRWSYASQYPQIKAGPHSDDIYYQIIHRSENRRSLSFAAWRQKAGNLIPYVAMPSWTLNETLDALADSSEVPVDAWRDLATLFLERLKPDEKSSD